MKNAAKAGMKFPVMGLGTEGHGWKEGQKDKLKDEAVRLSMTGRNANRHSDIVNSKVDSWYMYDMLKNSFSDGRRSKRKNDIII